MRKNDRPPGWTVIHNDLLTDAEKINALQVMLTKERDKNRKRNQRRTRAITAIAKEWEQLFDEQFGEDDDA